MLVYYVWYRLDADAGEAETVIRHMMSRLACRSGVRGRLMKKREEPRQWLEVYEGVADATTFERLLTQAVDEFDVEMFCDGPRHLECFIADAPVAAACALPT